MQQLNLTNFVNTAVNQAAVMQQPITVNGETILPANATKAETEKASKNIMSRSLNAAKEIGMTVGLGLVGGTLAGGVITLIPAKNTDRISDVLCDTFIKSGLKEIGEYENALPDVDFKNAGEQLQKAKEYIEISKLANSAEVSKDEAKNILQKFSDAAWALKKSSIEYINKAVKEDGLLNFAKKEAGKIRTKEIMTRAASIGFTTGLAVLLLSTLSSMFKKEEDKK